MSRALVLAGGGVTGVAWETGVLMGMLDAGCDVVAGVDLVVGTSAGSTVGAQILSGESLEASYARQIDDNHAEISPQIDLELLALIFGELAAGGTSTDEQRIRIWNTRTANTNCQRRDSTRSYRAETSLSCNGHPLHSLSPPSTLRQVSL